MIAQPVGRYSAVVFVSFYSNLCLSCYLYSPYDVDRSGQLKSRDRTQYIIPSSLLFALTISSLLLSSSSCESLSLAISVGLTSRFPLE
ncbi:hypothetical protein H4582DRAFT_1904559 [Lactarius indigo]|nr:hypothetical protein H4582DRAFT_1904559 [Lactarius indigo]